MVLVSSDTIMVVSDEGVACLNVFRLSVTYADVGAVVLGGF